MAIHHAQLKKANKAGYTLTEEGDYILALWPEYNARVYAPNASEAMRQMQATQVLYSRGCRIEPDANDRTQVWVQQTDTGMTLVGSPMSPFDAFEVINRGEPEWVEDVALAANAEVVTEVIESTIEDAVERNEDGIPLNGGEAHARGFTAADCPYSSEDEGEYDNFVRWNEEYDAAADAAEEEEGKKGSVVKEEYRARYAEAGHPTHCGDDLAVVLNNLCAGKDSTDLERFEAICEANGVSLAKYNRTTNGWQGRLRMTGRNLLARKVWENDGVLLTPVEGAEPEYRMSREWMATRKFSKEG